MKPFFMHFPALLAAAAAAASAWYYCCCFCFVSHAGSFYAEAFLVPLSSIPAGDVSSQRGLARQATSSARWHSNAAATTAKTATCSATASHHQQPHSHSRIPRTTTTATLLTAAHHAHGGPTHQR
ncbi:unnamed protein product, partial [Laminaria digitata]